MHASPIKKEMASRTAMLIWARYGDRYRDRYRGRVAVGLAIWAFDRPSDLPSGQARHLAGNPARVSA